MARLNIAQPPADIDYLIVGGGSAGCVVASRLSERSDLRVALIESGPAFTPSSEPRSIGDIVTRSYLNPGFMWGGLTAVTNGDPDDPQNGPGIPYGQARVLGGGSSVNGMHAHRGLPGDYDEWGDFGVTGWSWSDILPFYRKVEADQDVDGPLHGKSGPITISRYGDSDLSPFERAIDAEWAKRQLPAIADLNGLEAAGRFKVPLSMHDGRRMSTVRAYLTDAVQARPNLFVAGDMSVTRLLVVNGQARGVEIESEAGPVQLEARHIVLCAGALLSPTLLQRSGIGDAEALRAIGIVPVANRSGVGRNLQNHPTVLLAAHLRRRSRLSAARGPGVSGARYSSGLPGCPEGDMINTTMGMAPDATERNPLGRHIGALFSIVNKPYSRGEVFPTREGNPKVAFRMLSDERDLTRLIQGWQGIRTMLTLGEGAAHVDEVFVPMNLGRSDDSLTTALLNRLAAALLDSSAAIRRRIIRRVGLMVEDIPEDGPELRSWIMKLGFPSYHASGSCRMGREDDPNAVVDSRCRLIGVANVSVVDASIFPTLMRSGTNLPAIMAGEKMAAAMLEDNRHAQAEPL